MPVNCMGNMQCKRHICFWHMYAITCEVDVAAAYVWHIYIPVSYLCVQEGNVFCICNMAAIFVQGYIAIT